MLKEIIVQSSFRRLNCKIAAAVAGLALLLTASVGKAVVGADFAWAAAPLLLMGLAEAGLLALQSRCIELIKVKASDDEAALIVERGQTSVIRYIVSALSLSIWPYYLGLFVLAAMGGNQIAAANRSSAFQAIQALNSSAVMPQYVHSPNVPTGFSSVPQRTGGGPPVRSQSSPAAQRVAPPAFTAPRTVAPGKLPPFAGPGAAIPNPSPNFVLPKTTAEPPPKE